RSSQIKSFGILIDPIPSSAVEFLNGNEDRILSLRKAGEAGKSEHVRPLNAGRMRSNLRETVEHPVSICIEQFGVGRPQNESSNDSSGSDSPNYQACGRGASAATNGMRTRDIDSSGQQALE